MPHVQAASQESDPGTARTKPPSGDALIAFRILCGLVALIAPSRGKSPFGAFLVSVFGSPLLGFLLVVLLPAENRRKCPHCRESIRKDANVCRFCGRDVAAVNA